MIRFALAWLLACLLPGGALAFNLSRDIPPQALQHLTVLGAQVRDAFPAFRTPEYFGALIEHESGCPAIRRMCWNQNARLKSKREEGAGLGQLTRAYRADGSERFDALAEVRRLDRGLAELSWDNVYSRPDLQMRAMVVMVRQSWNRLRPTVREGGDVLHFVDAAYNGGLGGVMNERRACGLRAGCDAHRWDGHVEKVCLKSAKPLYGTRSACDINRHHVHDVLKRMPKYRGRV